MNASRSTNSSSARSVATRAVLAAAHPDAVSYTHLETGPARGSESQPGFFDSQRDGLTIGPRVPAISPDDDAELQALLAQSPSSTAGGVLVAGLGGAHLNTSSVIQDGIVPKLAGLGVRVSEYSRALLPRETTAESFVADQRASANAWYDELIGTTGNLSLIHI